MIPVGTDTLSAPPDARMQRRQAFVDAARDAFFARGYGDTSMSSIAAAVGGSKTTLWAHFPSKEDLFAAVLDDVIGGFSDAMKMEFDPAEPVEVALHRFAGALMEKLLSPQILALNRVVIGEAQRFPEIGAMFYERGPKRGKARLAAFFAAAMSDGRPRPGDSMIAARQFSSMCQGGCFQEMMFGVAAFRSADDVTRDIEAAVDTFMRAWGLPPR